MSSFLVVQTGLSLCYCYIRSPIVIIESIYPSGIHIIFCFQTLLIVLVIWFILEYRVVEGRKNVGYYVCCCLVYTLPCLISFCSTHEYTHTHTHTTKFQTMFIYFPYGFRLLPILILITTVIIRINKIEIEVKSNSPPSSFFPQRVVIRWCWWCCSWEHYTYFVSLSLPPFQ